MPLPEEVPEESSESFYQHMEDLLEAEEDLQRMHRHLPCRFRGKERSTTGARFHEGLWTGCPKCKATTGDPFAGWRLKVELDYLCDGGDPKQTPELLSGEEE